ncbi:hypothetical protein [Longimicrobium terrae]|uniref:Uncharacterized protein n=1 Tax=Longimicrobium terrae TaxID=1639882 RepID=A0A841H4N3_9BACT|nr:hypothetical protein [Longimicrobium terrae]MBB4638662.1 hypothetical protein [Longimicrobium terrae]MBB6072902.1 hypothetical protein [Longimicrobium terrae]NNC31515.1 hypothetical protein [Longimicrobium terrae]
MAIRRPLDGHHAERSPPFPHRTIRSRFPESAPAGRAPTPPAAADDPRSSLRDNGIGCAHLTID